MSSYTNTIDDVDATLRSPLNLEKLSQLLHDVQLGTNEKLIRGPNYRQIVLPLTRIEQFKFGQSNPTYLIVDSSRQKFVLRRKPTRNKDLVSPKSHNVEREFKFLAAICRYNQEENAQIPVSEMVLLCEDESYVGYVFYIMEFVQGVIFHDPFMSSISESQRYQLYMSAVAVAASIHQIDTAKLSRHLPLNYFPSAKSSFFDRQVKTLSKISHMQASSPGVDEIPHFTEISNWLQSESPRDPEPPSLIHGDFKIDNLVFDLKTNKVIAVLDWELTTLGHPIFDLSNLLQPCILPHDLNKSINNTGSTSLAEPFDNCIAKCLAKYYDYNSSIGKPERLWKIGVVFGLYRVAVITQGVSMRSLKGVASSAEAEKFSQLYRVFGQLLMDHIKRDLKL